uniref:Uncharacterized protein n=1 Tax=Populus trichocarpa TaxID=3694 RepID=A0A2K1R6H2_POPTR
MCHEEKNEGKHYCSNKVLDGKGQALDFLILSICSMLTWTLLMVRNASRSLLVGNHLSFYSTLREDCRAYRSFQPSRDMVQSWEYASRVSWAAALLSI